MAAIQAQRLALRALVARHHASFNERDLDAWSGVFDDRVELVVDGAPFRGIAAARAYVSAGLSRVPQPAHPRYASRRRERRHDRRRASRPQWRSVVRAAAAAR